jgi:cytoskeletal protein CcmA (bactofilin family)
MIFGKKYGFSSQPLTTYLGENTHVKGTLHTQMSIRIDGVIEGDIHAQGEVFIGEKSKIKANIVAKRIVVAGEVIGSIEALQGLEILSSGRVYGDIRGARLTIQKGAVYRGRVNMDVIVSENPYEGEVHLVH